MAGTDWIAQLKEIAIDLTAIEINTIESAGMTGRKMPVWPHALIDVAQKYADFLTGPVVRLDLDAFAADYADPEGARPGVRREPPEVVQAPPLLVRGRSTVAEEEVKTVTTAMRRLAPVFKPEQSFYTFRLTNGAETFDLLRWAATNILAFGSGRAPAIPAGDPPPPPDAPPPDAPPQDVVPPPTIDASTRAILLRIQRSCDQLEGMAETMRGLFPDQVGVTRAGLQEIEAKGARPQGAPAEIATRLRKAWDIGTEQIVMQTVVQIDGDLIFRARQDILAGANQAFALAHERATGTALGHWRSLFDLVSGLLMNRGGAILGRDYQPGGR